MIIGNPSSLAELMLPNEAAYDTILAFSECALPSPGLLLYGPFGTGKSEAARVIIREAMTFRLGQHPTPFDPNDLFHTNAALNGNVAELQRVATFSSVYPGDRARRGWLCDEVHEFGAAASDALKGTFDLLARRDVVMVFTANDLSEVPAAIQSRAITLFWPRPSEAQLIARANQLLERYAVQHLLTSSRVVQLVRQCGGDARRLINLLNSAVHAAQRKARAGTT